MGGDLTFRKLADYQTVEGTLYALCIWLMILVLTIVSCLIVIRHFCPKWVRDLAFPHRCNCGVAYSAVAYISTVILVAILSPILCIVIFPVSLGILVPVARFRKFLDDIAETSNRRLKGELHAFLAVIFPDLIAKKRSTKKVEAGGSRDSGKFVAVDEGCEHVALVMDEKSEKGDVCLFGDKEFNIERRSIPCCPWLPSYLVHGYTYFYFMAVSILAFHWFIAVVAEGIIYSKTTTCSDINLNDTSFACFSVENSTLVDCRFARNDTSVDVFCYMYNPNLAAFGVGFSVFRLMVFVVTLYFKFAIKVAGNKYGKYVLVFVQALLTFFWLVVFPALLLSVYYRWTSEIYFFYGNSVIRWTMFVLIVVSAVLVTLVPWCGFTHKTVYKDITHEEGRNPQDDMSQPGSSLPMGNASQPASLPMGNASQPGSSLPMGNAFQPASLPMGNASQPASIPIDNMSQPDTVGNIRSQPGQPQDNASRPGNGQPQDDISQPSNCHPGDHVSQPGNSHQPNNCLPRDHGPNSLLAGNMSQPGDKDHVSNSHLGSQTSNIDPTGNVSQPDNSPDYYRSQPGNADTI